MENLNINHILNRDDIVINIKNKLEQKAGKMKSKNKYKNKSKNKNRLKRNKINKTKRKNL